MSTSWVIWIPKQDGYLLDEAMPQIVTSYGWHAKRFLDLAEAMRAAGIVGGYALEDNGEI